MYRPGMSAFDARALGLEVPEQVPDFATAEFSVNPLTAKGVPDPKDPTRYTFTTTITWTWTWFTGTYILD